MVSAIQSSHAVAFIKIFFECAVTFGYPVEIRTYQCNVVEKTFNIRLNNWIWEFLNNKLFLYFILGGP